MNSLLRSLACSLLLTAALAPSLAAAAGLGGAVARGAARGTERAVARGAARGAERSVARGAARGAERSAVRGARRAAMPARPRIAPGRSAHAERLRDLGIRPRPLPQARTVRRAVTAQQLRIDRSRGIAANRHFTSRPARGRMPTAEHFRKAYGIPHRVSRVETVRLPKGQPVRFAKVVRGQPGRGEITSPARVPASRITAVHRLHPSARR